MSNEEKKILLSGESDRRVRALVTDGNMRAVAVCAREIVSELGRRHGLDDTQMQRMGEALIAALLVATSVKEGERLNLNIQSSGQLRQVIVDVDHAANIRGYPIVHNFEEGDLADLNEDRGPWGTGILSFLKTQVTEGKQPYIGSVPLATGFLAKDATYYLLQSEQIASAVGISVLVEGGTVKSANGFLLQMMPGASEGEIESIESKLVESNHLTEKLERSQSPAEILGQLLDDCTFHLVGEESVQWFCNCSSDRVSRAIRLLGEKEIRSILSEEGEAKTHCEFCLQEYTVSEAELKSFLG